jgi:hypothetical protein
LAAILVDYENVWAASGLKGIEYLNSNDKLYIFYSQCCGKIRAEYMDAIEKTGCDFQVYKLVNTGKNALDFYIASECGAISETGEKQIAIISNDRGFKAVADFLKIKTDAQTTVVIASNIESGLLTLNASDDRARRSILQAKAKMLDIAVEQARYAERNSMKHKLKMALLGTKYECITNKILKYVDANQQITPKQLHTGSLHQFGRADGVAIYQILKKVV